MSVEFPLALAAGRDAAVQHGETALAAALDAMLAEVIRTRLDEQAGNGFGRAHFDRFNALVNEYKESNR